MLKVVAYKTVIYKDIIDKKSVIFYNFAHEIKKQKLACFQYQIYQYNSENEFCLMK